MTKNEQAATWALLLAEKVGEFMDENPDCLENDESATTFFHALGNIVPSHVYSKVTGEDIDLLENLANMTRIAFQYIKSEE